MTTWDEHLSGAFAELVPDQKAREDAADEREGRSSAAQGEPRGGNDQTNSREAWMSELTIPVVRLALAPAELRADQQPEQTDPNSLGFLFGHFSRFDDWYEVDSIWEGRFMERVLRGAYSQTFTEDRERMRILFEHGMDPQIGAKVLAPLRDGGEDRDGGFYGGPLFDTSYNRDLVPGLRAGVYGASMRMQVREESWVDEPPKSDYNPRGLPERTIRNTRVFEMGPVTFGASPRATAGVRSLSATDHYYELLARNDEGQYADALRSVQRVRPDFTGEPVTRSAGRGERKEPDQRPGSGGTGEQGQFDPLDDPEQRHLYLRQLGVIHGTD